MAFIFFTRYLGDAELMFALLISSCCSNSSPGITRTLLVSAALVTQPSFPWQFWLVRAERRELHKTNVPELGNKRPRSTASNWGGNAVLCSCSSIHCCYTWGYRIYTQVELFKRLQKRPSGSLWHLCSLITSKKTPKLYTDIHIYGDVIFYSYYL